MIKVGDYIKYSERWLKENSWYGDNNGIHYYKSEREDDVYQVLEVYNNAYKVKVIESDDKSCIGNCCYVAMADMEKIKNVQLSIFDF